MSITDELRKEARGFGRYVYTAPQADCLTAIADRIDEEHERTVGFCKRLEDAAAKREDVEIFGVEYTALPLDADGEYIHEHDKVDWLDHAGTWHENVTVVAVCDDGCYVMDGTVFHVHKSNIRHHHEPTVEDVLREMLEQAVGYSDAHTTVALNAIAEFAAKLRLANDGKEQQ